MSERGVIMQGHSVRGILENRKTQTRRVPTVGNSLVDGSRVRAKFWDNLDFASPHVFVDKGPSPAGNAGPYLHVPDKQNDCRHRVYPLWRVGDRLWVKESWKICDWTEDGWPFVSYKADGARRLCTENISEEWNERLSNIWEDLSFDLAETASDKHWRSVLHMPRWASRITLEVVEIRAERVQDLSGADALAEGYDEERCVEVFKKAAGKNELKDAYWFYYDESGDDFCEACARKLARKKPYSEWGLSGGPSAAESDGPAFCTKCGAPILMSLSSYAIERELRLEADPEGKEPQYFPVSGKDACIAGMIADGIGDLQESHLPRLAQIGFSTAWNKLNAPRGYGWDANPWVWAHTFKVVEPSSVSPCLRGEKERA